MKTSYVAVVAVLALVLGGVSFFEKSTAPRPDVAKETRLEQVKRTGVLRCGYSTFPPFFIKDPNTGKFSGVTYDIVEEMGKQLGIKIDWVGEVATGQMLSDLNMNRYDMVCTIFGRFPARAREASATLPFVYLPLNLYVRADDTRFDQDFDLANKPEVKFAALDGEVSSIGANESFPEAAKIAIPQFSSAADLFMSVATKKADAVIQDPYVFDEYKKNNPGILKQAGGRIFSVVPCGMPLPANEPALKDTLDMTLAYLLDNGFVNRILKKYEGEAKYVRPAKSFAE